MDTAEYTGLGSYVKRGAFAARSASCALVYGVGLGVPRAAELQPLSRRDPSFLPDAVAYIRTVYGTCGSTVISCGDYLFIPDDNGTNLPGETGTAYFAVFGDLHRPFCK